MGFVKKDIYDAKADPLFSEPYVDAEEICSREVIFGNTVTYRYIHGGFVNTGVKFMLCLPLKEHFEWRFFQHLSPFPGADEEMAALNKTGEEDFIGFALTHGAAYVESNMGATVMFGAVADASIYYKSSAAVAQYCRVKAQELYGTHRIYGYVFGGSGGGYKTMSCIENTNAFDGAVPYVIGSPMSLPNCLTIAAHGARMLRHCWPQIVEALEPGGNGDIYAGLTKDEQDALRELVKMGIPPRVCADFQFEDDGSLPVLTPAVRELDPTYFTDFWTKPGYLGSDVNGSAVRDRVHMYTKVVCAGLTTVSAVDKAYDDRNGTDDAWQKMMADASGAFIEVENVPEGEDLFLRGVDIIFESGKAKGKKLRLKSIEGKRLVPGMSYGADDYMEVIGDLCVGDEVFLDNSDYIAIQTYHRHQVPEDLNFHAWDQFRNADGTPALPQRDFVIGPGFTAGGCGSVQDGKIQGKVIVINNLMDGDFPWQADWYRRKVEEVYGDQAKDLFRLYYNDNCPHGDVSEGGDMLRVVSYLGMLHQALLDVAHWVENGITPADTTGYTLVDNQIILAEDSAVRGGIQPNVQLLAAGSLCACAKVGENVTFTATVEIPEFAGKFVDAQFSFEGEQDFPYTEYSVEKVSREAGITKVQISAHHIFKTPGNYFTVVRVTSNRDVNDGYTQLRNLARARVVVAI